MIKKLGNYKYWGGNFDLEKYNYLNDLNNNKKNYLLKQIKYDYQKKIILEKFLKKKNISKEVVNDQILDLYSIEIIYFSFDKKYENNLNDITRIIKTKDINLIKKELDKKSIVYKENNRKLVSLNNLDQETIASGDFIAFSDEGSAGVPTKRESIDDIREKIYSVNLRKVNMCEIHRILYLQI